MTDQKCVACSCDTSPGSGRFVNRIPADDGFLCTKCAAFTCDRCDQLIAIDEDLTPQDVFGDNTSRRCFSDGSDRICESCLTPLENANFKETNNMSQFTYSLLINAVWTCMYTGGSEEARKHMKEANATEARLYQNGRYLGVVKGAC